MATENYVSDIARYLSSGHLSDLTWRFGEKSWKIHKIIAGSHSKWFPNAANIGFEESNSGIITLKDDPEFADAIDCMVSYFYEAEYRVTEYDTPKSLLHAQVAIIAHKYDCASLYQLAKASFASAVKLIDIDTWFTVAAFVYNQTSTEVPNHEYLRKYVVSTMVDHLLTMNAVPWVDKLVELLQSSSYLAIDLLVCQLRIGRFKSESYRIAECNYCNYTHVGPLPCSNLALPGGRMCCPHCEHDLYASPAYACTGCHTGGQNVRPPE